MSAKFSMLLAGAEQLTRALKLANPKTRARVAKAIHDSTNAIAQAAKARAPRKSGEMANTIRAEFAADGLVGFVKVGLGKLPRRSKAKTAKGLVRARGRTRKVGPGAYAPVVERGDPRRNRKPHPFLIPAFDQRKPQAVADIKNAMDNTVEEIARG